MTALLALCVLALGFGITWLVFDTRAQRIAARRTQELERATGVPAAETLRDCVSTDSRPSSGLLRTGSTRTPSHAVAARPATRVVVKHPDVARLRTVPLFEGLADDELTRIASWLDVAELRAGTSITSEGDPGCEFFVLDEGTVDVMHEGRRVASLSRDDVFGELAILGGGQRTAEAVARTDVVILQMFGTHFREMQAMTPVVDERLRRLAAERSGPLDATD